MAEAKKNAGARTTIVFLDESGFSERPLVKRTWSPRGHTPVLRIRCRSWQRVSAIGALAYRGTRAEPGVFLRLYEDVIHGEEVRSFLAHLLRHIRGRLLLLWDGLHAHRSVLVQEWMRKHPRLQVERLPAYAPELNPVEGLWAWLKASRLPNACPATLEPVGREVRAGIRRARGRAGLLEGFLKKADLSF